MLKYKQVNVVHPEDVGVPRKIMSDPPEDQHPSPAFKGSIWPLLIILLIVLALAVSFLPWPEQIVLRMQGAEVDAQGNVIAEGELLIEGWRYHYLFRNEKFHPTNIALPGAEVKWIHEIQGDSGFYPWLRDHIRAGLAFTLQNGENWLGSIITTEDYDFAVIHDPGHKNMYVGIVDGSTDYSGLLEQCGLLKAG